MKRKWYVVILGTVALIGLCLWLGQVSPKQTPVQVSVREPGTATRPTERQFITRTSLLEPATTDVVNRLEADVTILLAERDAMRRDENLQTLVDSIGFNDTPMALQF